MEEEELLGEPKVCRTQKIQKKPKVLLKNQEKEEMFKEKIHEELQEDLQ